MLDHHASNTRFGTLHLVDPAAAATAVLADELITRLGLPVTRDIAAGLYAGIVTDTGSFKYPAPRRGSHELAARLLRTGIDPSAVATELWDRAPFGYLRLLSLVLGRAVLEPDAAGGHGLVWTTVSRADRAAYGLPYDVTEPVIDVLRRTDEADVAVVFKEDRRRRLAGLDPVQGPDGRGPGVHPGRRRRARLRGRASPRPARCRTRSRCCAPGWPARPGCRRDRAQRAGHRRQARRADLARRGGQDPPAGGHPPGRARRHARPDGHRRAGGRRGEGHPAARPPGADREGVRRHRSGSARPPTPTTPRARSPPRPRPRGSPDDAWPRRLAALTGEIEQVPPRVSAIKVDGQRAYQLARAGRGRRAGRPPGHRPRARRSATSGRTATWLDVDVDGDLLQRHLHPGARPRPGRRARRRRAPDRAAAHPGRAVHARRTPAPWTSSPPTFAITPLPDAAAAAFPRRDLTAAGGGPGVARRRGCPRPAPGPRRSPRSARTARLIALVTEEAGQARPLAVFVP